MRLASEEMEMAAHVVPRRVSLSRVKLRLGLRSSPMLCFMRFPNQFSDDRFPELPSPSMERPALNALIQPGVYNDCP